MEYLDFTWVIALISIIGSFFNVKKNVVCFYLWAITEILCFVIDFKNRQFGRAFLDTFSFCINIYGIISWSQDDKFTQTNIENTQNPQ